GYECPSIPLYDCGDHDELCDYDPRSVATSALIKPDMNRPPLLDEQLAAAIQAKNADALATWRSIGSAAGFFATHKAWSNYAPEAVAGVISNFSGPNQFLTNELLNLLARNNEQYRIIPKTKAAASSLSGLKAVIYVDTDP